MGREAFKVAVRKEKSQLPADKVTVKGYSE